MLPSRPTTRGEQGAFGQVQVRYGSAFDAGTQGGTHVDQRLVVGESHELHKAVSGQPRLDSSDQELDDVYGCVDAQQAKEVDVVAAAGHGDRPRDAKVLAWQADSRRG